MECTKCKKQIVPGQKYHRTKRGPHHQDCSNVQGTPAVAVQRVVSRLIEAVPSNWLDPMLTGDKAVIDHSKPMFTGRDIEKMFNALRDRMQKIVTQETVNDRS
jgi:hypothetical protein